MDSEDDIDWNPYAVQNRRKRKYPKSIDVEITNVWTTFDARCEFDLVHIVKNGHNVEYDPRGAGKAGLKMALRNPYRIATIHKSGKIICTGATSEENSRITARQFGRQLQKMGYAVQFRNFKINNVVARVFFPFDIDLGKLAQGNKGLWFEPELMPSVEYKIDDFKANINIFRTGYISIKAPSEKNVKLAAEQVYSLVERYAK